jgi:hypothetical protein
VTPLRLTVLLVVAVLAAQPLASADGNARTKSDKSAPADAPPPPAAKPAAETATPAADGKAAPTTPEAGAAKLETDAAKAVEKPSDKWSDAEIADSKAHCAVVLARIHAIALPHEPIKDGACGAPAPIELISIGKNPEVALSPPAIVRCDLAETLVQWLENDLQPLARKHLKSEIIKIETMSSYSCRNAYGRKTTKLSEHGLANAVDIGGFVMASAKTAEVLADWGTPQREILERIAAEKAAEEQRAAMAATALKAGQQKLASGAGKEITPPAAIASPIGTPGMGLARATIIDGVPKLTVTLPGGKPASVAQTFSAAQPDRLGGPVPRAEKPDTSSQKVLAAVARAEPDTVRPEVRAFLHEAHDAACKIFGTTLGPEANADHRNHFHVDMAPRKVTKICD